MKINYVIICLVALLVIYPIFRPGFLVAMDNPEHMLESYLMVDMLKQTKWVHGWSMSAFAGFPLGAYPKYQIGILSVAFLNLLFNIPVDIAYKLVLYASYAFAACSLYFLISRRFGRMPAIVSAVFFLLIRRDVIVIVLGGIWNNFIGIGFMFLFMHYTDLFFRRDTFKNATIAGIFLALTFLSHIFSALIALFFLGFYFLIYSYKAGNLSKMLKSIWIVLLSILISSYFLLQALDTGNWVNGVGFSIAHNLWELPQKLLLPLVLSVPKGLMASDIYNATDIFSFLGAGLSFLVSSLPHILIFMFAVLGFFAYRKRSNTFLDAILMIAAVSLVFGSGFWFLMDISPLPFLRYIQSYRFIVYAKIAMVIFGSYGMHMLMANKFRNEFLSKYKAMIVAAPLIVMVVFFNYYTPLASEMQTSETIPVMSDIFDAWQWMGQNADKTARIFYQDFFHNFNEPTLGASHLPPMSYYYTGVATLGGWFDGSTYPNDDYMRSSRGMIFNKRITDISDDEIARNLKAFNAGYIVSVEDKLRDKLGSSDLFKLEYNKGDINVFKMKGFESNLIEYNGSYKLLFLEQDYLAFKLLNNHSDSDLVLKVQNHPYWHAYVDGKEVKIGTDSYFRMAIKVNEKAKVVEFRYRPFNSGYAVLSLVGIFAAGFIILVSGKYIRFQTK